MVQNIATPPQAQETQGESASSRQTEGNTSPRQATAGTGPNPFPNNLHSFLGEVAEGMAKQHREAMEIKIAQGAIVDLVINSTNGEQSLTKSKNPWSSRLEQTYQLELDSWLSKYTVSCNKLQAFLDFFNLTDEETNVVKESLAKIEKDQFMHDSLFDKQIPGTFTVSLRGRKFNTENRKTLCFTIARVLKAGLFLDHTKIVRIDLHGSDINDKQLNQLLEIFDGAGDLQIGSCKNVRLQNIKHPNPSAVSLIRTWGSSTQSAELDTFIKDMNNLRQLWIDQKQASLNNLPDAAQIHFFIDHHCLNSHSFSAAVFSDQCLKQVYKFDVSFEMVDLSGVVFSDRLKELIIIRTQTSEKDLQASLKHVKHLNVLDGQYTRFTYSWIPELMKAGLRLGLFRYNALYVSYETAKLYNESIQHLFKPHDKFAQHLLSED